MSNERDQQREMAGREVGVGEHPDTGRDLVRITINGVPVEIHRGRQSVAEIKRAGGVPEVDELAQLIVGKPRPLADDAHVTIKGEEQFVSYPRACASS